ncbi:hypothetical protein U1Q18_029129 [Sarracenia purpurea var. burkii]
MRILRKDLELMCKQEKKTLILNQEDVDKSRKECLLSLIGKVITNKPVNFFGVKNTMGMIWGQSEGLKVLEIEVAMKVGRSIGTVEDLSISETGSRKGHFFRVKANIYIQKPLKRGAKMKLGLGAQITVDIGAKHIERSKQRKEVPVNQPSNKSLNGASSQERNAFCNGLEGRDFKEMDIFHINHNKRNEGLDIGPKGMWPTRYWATKPQKTDTKKASQKVTKKRNFEESNDLTDVEIGCDYGFSKKSHVEGGTILHTPCAICHRWRRPAVNGPQWINETIGLELSGLGELPDNHQLKELCRFHPPI